MKTRTPTQLSLASGFSRVTGGGGDDLAVSTACAPAGETTEAVGVSFVSAHTGLKSGANAMDSIERGFASKP
jgi:hypothetical protein